LVSVFVFDTSEKVALLLVAVFGVVICSFVSLSIFAFRSESDEKVVRVVHSFYVLVQFQSIKINQ